ncbi:acetate/propionate family kinase [Aquabacterium soli]|uniref:Acetate kinase n=1 Tax=Aquabacterium soli TaxID=2493092 RepID=A0A3R8TDV5_9BURK|nr:acetate/propionate family kinase [Aquabacterium soli]RRS05411.1 acetate/propionate family kinase [Aquabacterium soli]
MSGSIHARQGLLLVLNAGSSSIKFSVFEVEPGGAPQERFGGQVEGIGGAARFTVKSSDGEPVGEHAWPEGVTVDHEQALHQIDDWLNAHLQGRAFLACSHRVVHGGLKHAAPVLIDDAVLTELEALCPLAPLHQPHNLAPIRAMRARLPNLPQIACFDTAFHRGQSEVVQQFALPRAITEAGVRRYGFHGLSYEYIASVLPQVHPRLANARVIVAHLGNGASLCAMQGGRSLASTMGFSALDGLAMGTRCGALDPGVVFHLLREMRLSPEQVEHMLYHDSGLLGMSGVSNDMRALRARATEPQVRQALDIYVHRIVREIGSMAAVLGGLDALIFTAGIGEHGVDTRAEVLQGCRWLGLELDAERNAASAACITRGDPAETPSAWVVPTDEEGMLARHALDVLARTA